MPRLFVAVPVPLPVAARLAAVLRVDVAALRMVRPELLHLTLAFLGAVPESRLEVIIDAVRCAAAGAPRFPVAFDRVGRFPEGGTVRVVWAGAGPAAPAFERLGSGVRAELARRGVPYDDTPLRAHVTLARVRENADPEEQRAVAAAIAAASVPEGLAFIAEAIEVVESVLSRAGPRYSSRARLALGRTERGTG